MFTGLHWSVLLVFLALSVVGLWVAYSFLNKNGLYLFCILASVLAVTSGNAVMFSHEIPVSLAIFPVIHFALLVCLHKFGEKDAKNLFFITLLSLAVLFVCTFFLGAYEDASLKFTVCLSWSFLGLYISPIFAFIVACSITYFLLSKIKIKSLKKFLVLAMFIAIASVLEILIYDFLVYVGVLSFGNFLLTLLIQIVLLSAISVGLGYFEQFLNREPKQVETKKEVAQEEPKKETSNEESNTPEDID